MYVQHCKAANAMASWYACFPLIGLACATERRLCPTIQDDEHVSHLLGVGAANQDKVPRILALSWLENAGWYCSSSITCQWVVRLMPATCSNSQPRPLT